MKRGVVPFILLLGLVLVIVIWESPVFSGRIAKADVKDVILWQNGPDSKTVTLNRERIDTFLDTYNRLKYKGRADGSGGTAEWGAMIVLQDGTEIHVNDFYNSRFEVSCDSRDWWYYLDSGDLRSYILAQLEAA